MTYTLYARPCCGKSIVEVLSNTVQFCAYAGMCIVGIHYGPLCCEVTVKL